MKDTWCLINSFSWHKNESCENISYSFYSISMNKMRRINKKKFSCVYKFSTRHFSDLVFNSLIIVTYCYKNIIVIILMISFISLDLKNFTNFFYININHWVLFSLRENNIHNNLLVKKNVFDLIIINENSIFSENEKMNTKIKLLSITIQQYHEKLIFNIVRMITHDVVLKIFWLKKHNSTIDWKKKIHIWKM